MTSTTPALAVRPAVPGSISLARGLAIAQLVLGLFTTVVLGFLALLGLAWTTEDGSGPSGLAVLTAAVFVASLILAIALACLAARLRPGGDRARAALVIIESIVAIGIVASFGGGWFDGVLVAPMLYVACAVGTVVALLQPTARAWCRGQVVTR